MALHRSWLLLLLLSVYAAPTCLAQTDCEVLRKSLDPLKQQKLQKDAWGAKEDALLKLGRFHECARNYAEAARWYRRAADLGSPPAQSNLGALYSVGQGVERDDSVAFKLFLRAALMGFPPAEMNVGIMFGAGRGVKQSDDAAFDWFSRAVAHKYYPAFPALARQYLYGRGVERDDAKALKLFEEGAKRGVLAGQEYMAWMYSKGRGVKRDVMKAVQWNLKAIESGSALAANNLGYLCEHGAEGLPASLEEAAKWYRVAAERGLPQGEFNLGLLYRDGRGVEKNHVESQRLLAAAAEHGFKVQASVEIVESATLAK
jgi:uncharacterized protein